MKTCLAFVDCRPNTVLRFSPEGLELFRAVDATNWKLASALQYIDDQLAAELRQCQRMIAISCVMVLAIHGMKSQFPSGATAATFAIPKTMVESGLLLQALVYASNAIGFHGYDESQMLAIALSLDGAFDANI